jgi:hypothetical protein
MVSANQPSESTQSARTELNPVHPPKNSREVQDGTPAKQRKKPATIGGDGLVIFELGNVPDFMPVVRLYATGRAGTMVWSVFPWLEKSPLLPIPFAFHPPKAV